MPFAHDFAHDLLESEERFGTRGLHDDAVEVVSRAGDALHLRVERRDHLTVERQAEHRALFLEHTDHGERKLVDTELAPDRIEIREILFRDLATDDHDLRAERILLL